MLSFKFFSPLTPLKHLQCDTCDQTFAYELWFWNIGKAYYNYSEMGLQYLVTRYHFTSLCTNKHEGPLLGNVNLNNPQ